MSLKNRVLSARKIQGLNQDELARRAGLTQATVSRIESGHLVDLRAKSLKRLADALRVRADYLLGTKRTGPIETDTSGAIITKLFPLLPENSRQLLATLAAGLWALEKEGKSHDREDQYRRDTAQS